jgi:hypothetical protein
MVKNMMTRVPHIMTIEHTLTSTYNEVKRDTLQYWEHHPSAGPDLPPAYHKSRLSVWSGSFVTITGWAANMHGELKAYGRQDARLDVVAQAHLHMTFLVLSPPSYECLADLPQEIAILKALYETHVQPVTCCVRQLQLLPLRNALVLAGIPDTPSFEARQRFTDAILQSAWVPWLKARYRERPLPPLFWHITLARYEAECLSPPLREVYRRYATERIPVMALGTPMLAAATYNASTALEL